MRPPDNHQLVPPRAGKQFEDELQLHYLAPGAFTVLPPDGRRRPDPPPAPEQYRYTPTARRSRNQAFAVIADSDTSRPASRSSSPSGRVSPFKGRGFNPTGSRHVSPRNSPPPPEDVRLSPHNLSPKHVSKIPQLRRKGSSAAFGEKVYHPDVPTTQKKISKRLSQSMSDIDGESDKQQRGRPPPSPRKAVFNKQPAFQRLSPIAGSSPEPSLTSPSRIPRSRSTPPSRKTSPSRTSHHLPNRPPASKTSVLRKSRNQLNTANSSRDSSPTKNTTSPVRTSSRKYKDVQAKVNSFSKPKPKVLPNSLVQSEQSEDSDLPKPKEKTPLNRKESVNRIRTNSQSNLLPKTGNYPKTNYSSDSSTSTTTNKNPKNNNANNRKPEELIINPNKTNNINNNNLQTHEKTNDATDITNNNASNLDNKAENHNNSKRTDNTLSEVESPIKGNKKDSKPEHIPSTTTVVSNTTSTVTQPLKIDANLNRIPHYYEETRSISPMVDGRVLSATSVTHAINKMNDTVLDTQTLIKDHGLSKLSPAASAIISMANDTKANHNPTAMETKFVTNALPKVEPLVKSVENSIHKPNHTNHVVHVMSSRELEDEVQRHMHKLLTPEHSLNKTVNDRVKEARTVVASDVKPIRITVREKPSDPEVQSGNIRMPMTNGLAERPGLPPSQETPPNEPEKQETAPKNACTKFFSNCRSKMCSCCKKDSTKFSKPKTDISCLSCLKKKPEPASIIVEDEKSKKSNFFDKINCCKKAKIGDSSCFPTGKRKDSWVERAESLSQPARKKCSKQCCKNFLRTIFCVGLCASCCTCCKKKPTEVPERKDSIISKKKSLTPTTAPPPEDTKPKIDISLVEHSSHMKGAIPILPICLAWFCLVMNCIAPGTGTVISGILCLCIGIPRFSQKDGPKPRIGAFIINLIIGFSQFFTVLFCLVGWGWSIWWGTIMIKIARKHKRFKQLEAIEQARSAPGTNPNPRQRDPERR